MPVQFKGSSLPAVPPTHKQVSSELGRIRSRSRYALRLQRTAPTFGLDLAPKRSVETGKFVSRQRRRHLKRLIYVVSGSKRIYMLREQILLLDFCCC